MNILIIGSTGGTGRRLVLQGLDAGHMVTAFARNPLDMMIRHENLSVVKGNVLDPASLEGAIEGKDAVLSALGSNSLGRSRAITEGTRNIIAAMEKKGVKRFVCETSLGVGDSKDQVTFLYKYILIPLLLKDAFADKEVQEQYIRESNLDWVIVRPAGLTDDPYTGRYHVWSGELGHSIKGSISRADVADLMLKQLTDNTYLRKAVGISY
jgi:putative NADH-flavin reductase